MTIAPDIEIALVVRNERERVVPALEDLLAQREVALRVVVHDNASTDDTVRRARAVARRHSRVDVMAHPRDLGILRNFARALDHATAPHFGWAAADDRRAPHHLCTLRARLDTHPDAILAATAARAVGPDGREGPIVPETAGLTRTFATGGPADAATRLAAWLRQAPCVPFYGLYRTRLLQPLAPVLAALAPAPARPLLRADAVFLAHLAARHPVILDPQALFSYHLGGASDTLERFESLEDLLAAYRRIAAGFRAAARATGPRGLARLRLARACHLQMMRLACGPPGRRRFLHALTARRRTLQALLAQVAARTDPALRRLTRRARAVSPGARIALAGGGKHTRRRLPALRAALGGRARIVAIADDRPRAPIRGVPVVAFGALAEHADLVIVSSDACEGLLLARARAAAPGVPAWSLYGPD